MATFDDVGDFKVVVAGTDWASETTELLKVMAWFPVEGEPQSLKTTRLITTGNIGVGIDPSTRAYGASPVLSGPLLKIQDGTNEATLALISGSGSGTGLNGASIELLDRDAADDTKWFNIRSQDGYGKIKSMKSDGSINKDNILNINLETGVIVSGNIGYDSLDPVFVVHKNITGAGNAHCFVDESIINKTGNAGYNSYNSDYVISGSQAYDHAIGFQASCHYHSTGIIETFGGFTSAVWVDAAAGVVNKLLNYSVYDYQGTGEVSNNVGFYAYPLTKGTNNWGVFIEGPTKSYFGGVLVLGGATTYDSTDPFVVVNRSITGTDNAHCFVDESTVNKTGTIGYNSYDVRAVVTGSQAYDHVLGFQAMASYISTGTLINFGGFASIPNIGASAGLVTNIKNFWVEDFTGGGNATNQYGLYVGPLSSATNNFGVYVAGTTKSFFGGFIGISILEPSAPLTISASGGIDSFHILNNSSSNKLTTSFLHSGSWSANTDGALMSMYDGTDTVQIRLDSRTGQDSWVNGVFNLETITGTSINISGASYFGDGGTTNYTEITTGGAIGLHGNAVISKSDGDLRLTSVNNDVVVTGTNIEAIGSFYVFDEISGQNYHEFTSTMYNLLGTVGEIRCTDTNLLINNSGNELTISSDIVRLVGGVIALTEITTPSVELGDGAFYFKSDNKAYVTTGDGVEHELAFAA